MSVKIGTTISGTFPDGSGLTGQSHLIYAANAGVWWYFTLTSASDTAANPGTHTIKSYVSSGPDLVESTWSAGTASPNLNGDTASITSRFWNGRSLGCLYINNSGGSNKDILHCSASIFPGTQPDAGNGIDGHIRAVLTATTVTWGAWGYYETPNFNYADTTLISGNCVDCTANGFVETAACCYHSELDAAVVTCTDPDTGDTWNAGGQGTGNFTSGSALVTALSSEAAMAVGYGVSGSVAWTANGTAKINSIDSGTQITASVTASANGTTAVVRWNNMSPGTNRTNLVIDSTMTHECTCYGFAPLANNADLVVYDSGGQAPPNIDNLKSCKSNQTEAQGYWPTTSDGTGCVNVFGSTSVQSIQDWCIIDVNVTNIFVAQRSGATTIRMNQYTDSGNGSWAAIANQPPALTGKTIKAGGGVMGVTNGIDLWLFVIDSTDNAIKYCKYTIASQSWSAWTLLESVPSTASVLSGFPLVAGGRYIGLSFNVTNGGSYDTYVSMLAVPPIGLYRNIPSTQRMA